MWVPHLPECRSQCSVLWCLTLYSGIARVLQVLVGVMEGQKLPVLNQGHPAIRVPGKRDSVMGHLKSILVAQCDEQRTSTLMVILPQDQISVSLRRKRHFLLSAHHRFIFAFPPYWFIRN